MQPDAIRELLESVRSGKTDVAEAMDRLRRLPFESLDFARIDHHRALRCGYPEVVFCEGKTPSQTAQIFDRLASSGADVLATRASREHADAVLDLRSGACYEETARCIHLRQSRPVETTGMIALIAAGTSDIPVLEEARVTCEVFGQRTTVLSDVGVAGVHRLLAHLDALHAARVIVAVAGMEGALPGVVKGLVTAPVIAVPTSIGYGANFSGVAPLLTMLNTCSPGVAVVNIDNGFAAGYLASLINRIGEPQHT